MWRTLLLLGLSSTALADAGPFSETIEVDQTIERGVGLAIGVACDAPEIVGAEMKTVEDTNVVVFTGRRVGATLCRAGTDPFLPSFLFEITVTPKRDR